MGGTESTGSGPQETLRGGESSEHRVRGRGMVGAWREQGAQGQAQAVSRKFLVLQALVNSIGQDNPHHMVGGRGVGRVSREQRVSN